MVIIQLIDDEGMGTLVIETRAQEEKSTVPAPTAPPPYVVPQVVPVIPTIRSRIPRS